jgi:hypothetical protein
LLEARIGSYFDPLRALGHASAATATGKASDRETAGHGERGGRDLAD